APGSDTLFGPPDRMTPIGLRAWIFSSGVSGGHTSEYTDSSRRRRAMSCVYCDPKSRTMMGCWPTARGSGLGVWDSRSGFAVRFGFDVISSRRIPNPRSPIPDYYNEC